MAKFNLKLVGCNEEGTRIFAVLREGKKPVIKGFYDFDTEHFTILKYYNNLSFGKKTARAILKEILMTERNWEL